MPIPIYQGADTKAALNAAGNRGLYFSRFFPFPDGWVIKKEDSGTKSEFIKKIAKDLCGNATQLQALCKQQEQLLKATSGKSAIYQTAWHLATGLGNDHPVENGFTWHPTLGTPYLPGSTVKGLVRAWCEVYHDFNSEAERQKKLLDWFGSAVKFDPSTAQQEQQQAGNFIFFDALPTEAVKLTPDIMTPHMGEWYAEGGKKPGRPETTPADWHDPVPVPFLVVKEAKFLFSIAPRYLPLEKEAKESALKDLDLLMDMLDKALQWLGIGAKTATGYGKMFKPETLAEEKQLLARWYNAAVGTPVAATNQGTTPAPTRNTPAPVAPSPVVEKPVVLSEAMKKIQALEAYFKRAKETQEFKGMFSQDLAQTFTFMENCTACKNDEKQAFVTLATEIYNTMGWGGDDKKQKTQKRLNKIYTP